MNKVEYTQPVKVGDIIEQITVENIGQKGDGVGKLNGFILMIEGGQLEKTYTIKIQRVFKSFATAKIIREVN